MSPAVGPGAYRKAFGDVARYARDWLRKHPRATAAELTARLVAQADALDAIRRGHCKRCGDPTHIRFGEANWRHDRDDRRECP